MASEYLTSEIPTAFVSFGDAKSPFYSFARDANGSRACGGLSVSVLPFGGRGPTSPVCVSFGPVVASQLTRKRGPSLWAGPRRRVCHGTIYGSARGVEGFGAAGPERKAWAAAAPVRISNDPLRGKGRPVR